MRDIVKEINNKLNEIEEGTIERVGSKKKGSWLVK